MEGLARGCNLSFAVNRSLISPSIAVSRSLISARISVMAAMMRASNAGSCCVVSSFIVIAPS